MRIVFVVAALVVLTFPLPVVAAAPWQEVDGAKIPTPPAEHPRLYLRAEHVAQLPQRLQDPVLQPAIQQLQTQAKRSPQSRVEWDALQYLVTHDEKLGRATVEATLPLLQKCELADRMDACRETGRMMVTGAIVYDWCYSLLTSDEKQAFIKELVRLAKTQECGYPPTGQGSVTGHASEAMIMRDMLSAGIAIYGEFPEMYRLAAGRFFREHLPVRNWFYPGHAYHQGDSYGPHRYSWDTYPLWIFDRLGAGNVYNPEQRFVPYWWIYTTRPDGQRLRAGDTFACSAPRGQPWSQYLGTLLTASYYHDGILLDQFQRQGGSGGNETIFEVLWRDTSLQPKSIGTLPLSWYSGSPFGWTVARTGWDAGAVIAEMKVNEYNFVNHQHLDAGAFQIYYQGALAIDSGVYQGGSAGGYGSTHCLNYSWRTIAHNSLLVYDPNEKSGGRGYGNDGGQRLPHGRSEARNLGVLLAPANGYRTGKVLAHGFGPDPQTPDFTFLQGDLTDAYSKKVRQVTRSFIFLNLHNSQVPAAMVVFDRVVSADPAFRKYWLLHTLEEPRIEGTSAVVDCTQHDSRGRLTLDVLLPCGTPAPAGSLSWRGRPALASGGHLGLPAPDRDAPAASGVQGQDALATAAVSQIGGGATLTKVGGPGQEYWVFGQNWPNDVDPQRLERTSVEPGAWRIEVSPKVPSAEDLFLNVMQVTDRQSPSRWPVRRLDAGERVGCMIEGPETSWVVLMRKDSQRSAAPVKFTVPGDRPGHVLVTDLTSGQWHAQREGSPETRNLVVNEDLGAAWFAGPAGAWTLSH
jgi:heparin/heparan-sulfate lyase